MSTPIERARLAAAVNLLRPDWPAKSLRTLLDRDHAHRPYHDLAVALVWIATDEQTKTPARLAEAGPWWTALATTVSPGPERFDHDRWHRDIVAGAVPAPPDFAEQVHAVKAATPRPEPADHRGIGRHDRQPADREQLEAARAELAAHEHRPRRTTRQPGQPGERSGAAQQPRESS